jgi:hypothetical protein
VYKNQQQNEKQVSNIICNDVDASIENIEREQFSELGQELSVNIAKNPNPDDLNKTGSIFEKY